MVVQAAMAHHAGQSLGFLQIRLASNHLGHYLLAGITTTAIQEGHLHLRQLEHLRCLELDHAQKGLSFFRNSRDGIVDLG
jgi:hypothetical protein